MKLAKQTLRIVLINLTAFLALSAFAGGIGLIAGWNTPAVEELSGSMFTSFVVPGLALFVLVGGSALLASLWLIRRHRLALHASALAGLAIMVFEFVEVLVLGSPPGVAQALQIVYFGVGVLISVVCIARSYLELVLASSPTLTAPD